MLSIKTTLKTIMMGFRWPTMLLLCHVAIWTICFDGRHMSVQKFNDYNDLVVCWLLLHFELGPSNDPMQKKVCPF